MDNTDQGQTIWLTKKILLYHTLSDPFGDRNVVINDYLEGGIKIDIFCFNKSLKATWIKKYLDVNNEGSWKTFFDLEFRQFGGLNMIW